MAAKDYGTPSASWIRHAGSTDDDHWRFGIAMSKCQNSSGACARTGQCEFGDCFRKRAKRSGELELRIERLEERLMEFERAIRKSKNRKDQKGQ